MTLSYKQPVTQAVQPPPPSPHPTSPIEQISPSILEIPSTQAPPPTVIPSPQPTEDHRCIISVNSVRYDVTQFRAIHSGGNIFRCGEDMTQTFYSQHTDATLGRMQQYRIP